MMLSSIIIHKKPSLVKIYRSYYICTWHVDIEHGEVKQGMDKDLVLGVSFA